ncbi:hypothetical protein ACOBV8_20015 (plasmid) [Pseudoalteromonas espejiana]
MVKCHVSSSAGSQAVDTNTIPSVAAERVEIITGGEHQRLRC